MSEYRDQTPPEVVESSRRLQEARHGRGDFWGDEDITQVLMHTDLVPRFEEWLDSCGLELSPPVQLAEDDLPCRIVTPGDPLARRIQL